MAKTVEDLINLAGESVDSEWSIQSRDNGKVEFKFENGRFHFIGTKKLADTEISDGVYGLIVRHFQQCRMAV